MTSPSSNPLPNLSTTTAPFATIPAPYPLFASASTDNVAGCSPIDPDTESNIDPPTALTPSILQRLTHRDIHQPDFRGQMPEFHPGSPAHAPAARHGTHVRHDDGYADSALATANETLAPASGSDTSTSIATHPRVLFNTPAHATDSHTPSSGTPKRRRRKKKGKASKPDNASSASSPSEPAPAPPLFPPFEWPADPVLATATATTTTHTPLAVQAWTQPDQHAPATPGGTEILLVGTTPVPTVAALAARLDRAFLHDPALAASPNMAPAWRARALRRGWTCVRELCVVWDWGRGRGQGPEGEMVIRTVLHEGNVRAVMAMLEARIGRDLLVVMFGGEG
jgi:hypothetical protein